jgi:hypothetical protein
MYCMCLCRWTRYTNDTVSVRCMTDCHFTVLYKSALNALEREGGQPAGALEYASRRFDDAMKKNATLDEAINARINAKTGRMRPSPQLTSARWNILFFASGY